MHQSSVSPAARSKLLDTNDRFGWISILLHWVTAIIIIMLWYFGKSVLNGPAEEADAMRRLHVSIASSAWLLLFARSVWRLQSGHPHVKGQSIRIHLMAKFAHYSILLVLCLMLFSGPLLVWAGGNSIVIFDIVSIPSPLSDSESIRRFAWLVHSTSSITLLVLVLLHIGGALKHLMFHSDDTIARMIWPGSSAVKERQ